MSYTRDKDRYTRGPGAIAAADNRRRFSRRVGMSRLSDERDRALAGYTFGPQGGLGRIQEDRTETEPQGSSPPPSTQGPGGSWIPPRLPGRGGPMPPPKPRPPTQGGGPYGPFLDPRGNTQVGPRPTVPPRTRGDTGPGPVVDPLPPAPQGGKPTTGAGGGPGTVPITDPSSYPVEPPDSGPDIPSSSPSQGIDLKKLAIIGAAAGAAWFLFFRKGGSTG